MGKSQPTISHHTRVLADAGLIEGEKRGKWTWWRVVPERLAALRQALGSTSAGVVVLPDARGGVTPTST